MKLSARAKLMSLLAIVLFTAGGGSKAWAVPAVPEGYHQDMQDLMDCPGESVILRQGWINEAGEYIVLFKEPNKPARIYLHWLTGASGGPEGVDVVYVDDQKMTVDE